MESVAAKRSIRKSGAVPRPLVSLIPQSLGALPRQIHALPEPERWTRDTSFGSFARSYTPAHTILGFHGAPGLVRACRSPTSSNAVSPGFRAARSPDAIA